MLTLSRPNLRDRATTTTRPTRVSGSITEKNSAMPTS